MPLTSPPPSNPPPPARKVPFPLLRREVEAVPPDEPTPGGGKRLSSPRESPFRQPSRTNAQSRRPALFFFRQDVSRTPPFSNSFAEAGVSERRSIFFFSVPLLFFLMNSLFRYYSPSPPFFRGTSPPSAEEKASNNGGASFLLDSRNGDFPFPARNESKFFPLVGDFPSLRGTTTPLHCLPILSPWKKGREGFPRQ